MKEIRVKRTHLVTPVVAIALVAFAGLAGCTASGDRVSDAVVSDPHASASPSANTEAVGEGGVIVGSTVFPDGAEILCSNLNVSDLAPWGHNVVPDMTPVSLTSFSACSAEVDTNGDGSASAVDGLTDWGQVAGGLLEQIDGGQTDVSLLNDADVWGTCLTGDHTETVVAEGWDYSTSCVSSEGIRTITHLIVAATVSGEVATLTCTVNAGPFSLDGREADVERFCSYVLSEAKRSGTYGD